MSETISLKKNEYLFKQGDQADCMYIVRTGQLSLIITDGIMQKEIDTASPGQLIGEMSLFDKQNRSASAIALMDTNLIRLPYDKLISELQIMPTWVLAILKNLSEKVREANTKILKNQNS